MPTPTYELSKLDPYAFEHMVNMICLKVLGAGHTGFGAGSDGGRDGYFVGKAPYPSTKESWSGRWYIQSKFMLPSLGKNSQAWLLDQVRDELAQFARADTRREWPDIWIMATNIDPSGVPETGAFDQALKLVRKARPQLASKFHIWGGRKILDQLGMYPEIADYYAEFITPGQVLGKLYQQLAGSSATAKEILRYLIVTQLGEQQYTKLEQAGSANDTRPGIQRLFTDIPFISPTTPSAGMAAVALAHTSAQNHRVVQRSDVSSEWKKWYLEPSRARIWFIKGGPGQGKSTLMQYFSQVQRAAFILGDTPPLVTPQQRDLAEDIKSHAVRAGLWPSVPRIPCVVELKEYAQWYGRTPATESRRLLCFLAQKLANAIGEPLSTGTLKRAFTFSRWLIVFDGLDEVPADVKDAVASEVTHFTDDVLVGCDTDALIVCTSRPQGYSGQFNSLDAALIELPPLSPDQALNCAKPVLSVDQSAEDAKRHFELLRDAISSATVQEIMTTPLQSHIMAVVVRNGGRPPQRKWLLYSNFYQTIKKREANRNLADPRIAKLLSEEDQLIKALHSRLGFELHARAETSRNAVTSLDRNELRRVVYDVVEQLKEREIDSTVELLMEATTERLVLVNTPETSGEVRFDIRPLQEFFAAEYIYDTDDIDVFSDRVRTISGDSHWREVLHFLFSGLIENGRKGELSTAVNALLQLNSGGDIESSRLLARRLALGALTAGRLLQEGVLDQDKRVRALFREVLSPLLGCTASAELITSAGPPQSAEWLYDVLLSGLTELTEPENIGAILLSVFLLPDEHPRASEAKAALQRASAEYQIAVMKLVNERCRSYRARTDRIVLPVWFLEIVYNFLTGKDWGRFGADGAVTAMRLIAFGAPRLAQCRQVPTPLVPILPPLFLNRYEVHLRGPDAETVVGLTRTHYYSPPEELKYSAWTSATWEALRDSGGLLHAVFLALQIVVHRSQSAATTFTNFAGGPSALQLLPDFVRDQFTEYADTLPNPAEKFDPDAWMQRDHPGSFRQFFWDSEHLDDVDFADTIIRDPWCVPLCMHGPEVRGKKLVEFVHTPEGARVLFRALESSSECAMYSAGVWGDFFTLPGAGDNIRRLIVSRAADVPPRTTFPGERLSVFRLRLPDEAALLPHLLALIVKRATAREQQDLLAGAQSVTARMAELAHRYIPEEHDLDKLLLDENLDQSSRAAAVVFRILGDFQNGVPGQSGPDVVRSYTPQNGHWFGPAVLAALTEGIFLRNEWAMSVASALLDVTRTDFETRQKIDPILRDWREFARAPVTKGSAVELWH